MTSSAGSDNTLGTLYEAYATDLVRVAFLLTGVQAQAEDVVHDVFVRCAGRVDALDHPLSYLRTAVVNECRTRHRRNRTSDVAVPEQVVMPDRVVETLDALGCLSEDQRTAIVLRYFVDLPEVEIAAVLGCRPATVRSHVHRGVAELRKVMS